MTQKNYIPADYDRIKVVQDIYGLLNEDFNPRANVILLPRRIQGDFDGLARVMAAVFNLGKDEIFIKYKEREKLDVVEKMLEKPELFAAMEVILKDMEFLHSAGARVHLRLLRGYSDASGTHGFHIDGMNQNFDRIMTCYNEPVTEYVRNEDVLSIEGHNAVVRDGAPVFSFRPGDIWRQRVRNKKPEGFLAKLKGAGENKLKRAFVHRAQKSKHPRLMVVGDMSVDG